MKLFDHFAPNEILTHYFFKNKILNETTWSKNNRKYQTGNILIVKVLLMEIIENSVFL